MESTHMGNQKIQEAILELKKRLIIKFGAATELHLFGSAVRGEYGSLSDIDILVLVPLEVTNSIEEEIFDLAYDVELKFNVVFGIIVYSKKIWESPLSMCMPIYQSIKNEGIAV
jgi:predicted nucleotidyltransferase